MFFTHDFFLGSRQDWLDVVRDNQGIRNGEWAATIIDSVRGNGLWDPYAGHIAADDVKIVGSNLRETIVARETNSRNRAVLMNLRELSATLDHPMRIYGTEAISPFAKRLKQLFRNYVGSEYLPTPEDRAAHPDVMHQDAHNFTFPDNSFDAYVSCEVFEHLPFLDKALQEAHRILAPGGRLLGTVPFAIGRDETIYKAELLPSGDIRHLIDEPEYHGNPTRPEEGALVFQVPAWDFLDQLKAAGFKNAMMRFTASAYLGIGAADSGGVLSIVAIK